MIKRARYIVFLRDVFIVTLSAFGGPQAHIAIFLDYFVTRRKYLTESELLELNALCQILPGPTSTQTITAIGFKTGGPNLAYLTLLVWCLPAVCIMIFFALLISTLEARDVSIEFTRFIMPMAIGFIACSAVKITTKVVASKTGVFIMVLAGIIAFSYNSPYVLPFILITAGAISALKYKKQPIEEKTPIKISWSNFLLWGGVLIFAAVLGHFTKDYSQAFPIRIFENFYRNGSLIFGGGQVLIPLLYSEFVEFKEYLSSAQFLSGYSIVHALPGPVFSFSAYIGALASPNQNMASQITSGFLASAGIFLPGTFLIFFVIRFWESLKRYRIVRASIEGINAASSGMIITAAILLFLSMPTTLLNVSILVSTFGLSYFTKIPSPFIVLIGLGLGFIL